MQTITGDDVRIGERFLAAVAGPDYEAAYGTARRLGASGLARAIAGHPAAAGEHVEKRIGRRDAARLAAGGLTRRELEFLRLDAAGHTSRSSLGQLDEAARRRDRLAASTPGRRTACSRRGRGS